MMIISSKAAPNKSAGEELNRSLYQAVYKKKLCSAQLSTKFCLLINIKMPTIVGILTFMSRKNSILGLNVSEI